MTKQKRVAIYARVSTDKQTTENQLQELRVLADRMGWLVVGEYIDQAISGSKGREQRPAFDQILKGATRRDFDVIASWSIDRLGRNLQHLVGFLSELQASGVDLYLHQQGVNTATPSGRAFFQMCGMFAEFEHAMIRERVMSGLARAKAEGRVLGRPKVSQELERRVLDLRRLKPKLGMIKIAKEVGVGVGTVQRIIKVN